MSDSEKDEPTQEITWIKKGTTKIDMCQKTVAIIF